jgi:dihydroorotase
MDIIIRNARINDPLSLFHNQTKDLLISQGLIALVDDNIANLDNYPEYQADNLCVSNGWFDIRASFADPGYEQKEDFISGTRAAAAGGFTAVAILPDTKPIIQGKSEIEYILSKTKENPVRVYPLGALTHNLESREISEMYDMFLAGAIGFSNANYPLDKADVLQRALLYTKSFDALILLHEQDISFTKKAQMHEGINSTLLGMKGFPALAEFTQIQRDLEVLRYVGGKLHFSHISTARSVQIIKQAKAEGLRVSCDVAAAQLYFTDAALFEYDTNYKVNPPFRAQEDIDALKLAVLDGTIDAICSDHAPHEIEQKRVEFDFAAFGIAGIQTVFPILNMVFSAEQIHDIVHHNLVAKPRQLFNLSVPKIKIGETANLTLYSTKSQWVLNEKTNQSKASNNPLWNTDLTGKIDGIINNNQIIWNQQ